MLDGLPPRPPSRDLDDPSEVAEMVRRFYRDVAQDDVLGPMFNDVARVDWSEHLPKLTAFWCRLLLGMPGYAGSPLRAHELIHAKRAFTSEQFERWLELFDEAVDLGWTGPNAEKAKAFAIRVADVHARYLDRKVGGSPRWKEPSKRSSGATPNRDGSSRCSPTTQPAS